MRAAMRGDLDTAWQYSLVAEDLGRQAESMNAQMMVYTLRMAIADARGNLAEMLPAAEMFRAMIDDWPGWDAMYARLYAATGRTGDARGHLRRLMDAGVAVIRKDSEWLELLWQWGEAAVQLDEPEAARVIAQALRPYGDLWVVDGIGGACFGPVSAHLARLDAFLGRPATCTARPGSPEGGTFRREGRLWEVEFRGRAAAVTHSKGMSDLRHLLANPEREIHVLDLVELAGGPAAAAADGDTGPVLDATGRRAYTKRLREIEADLEAADAAADRGRAERLSAEREFLLAELGAALGLGGRDRVTGDHAERARKAVTMRVATALRAIEAAHPALAKHLNSAVSTGRFCCYRPEQRVTWRT
jgi:hypothetical protein